MKRFLELREALLDFIVEGDSEPAMVVLSSLKIVHSNCPFPSFPPLEAIYVCSNPLEGFERLYSPIWEQTIDLLFAMFWPICTIAKLLCVTLQIVIPQF